MKTAISVINISLALMSAYLNCGKAYSSEEYIKTDVSSYAQSIFDNKNEMIGNNDISMSVINSEAEFDKSEISSFADAFLWASGSRAVLSTSNISRLNIVYLKYFKNRNQPDLDRNVYSQLFQENFDIIQENGPCARLDITNYEGKRYTIVYLDANQSKDLRLTCVYRNFRSLYGMSEKYQMQDFSSTFVTDLRLLRCIRGTGRPKLLEALAAGQC